MDDTTSASGASVARKNRLMAVKPDGERANANIQPPTVPNTKKNGIYGGRWMPALRIRTHKVMYAAGQTSSAKTAKMISHFMRVRCHLTTELSHAGPRTQANPQLHGKPEAFPGVG